MYKKIDEIFHFGIKSKNIEWGLYWRGRIL